MLVFSERPMKTHSDLSIYQTRLLTVISRLCDNHLHSVCFFNKKNVLAWHCLEFTELHVHLCKCSRLNLQLHMNGKVNMKHYRGE